MTAIPEPTQEELNEYRDLEAQYAWASQDFEIGIDPGSLREALRVLSHFQRENERLKSELKSALADSERIDWLERNSQFSTACDVGPYIQINSPIAKSLREIVDERRKA